MTWIDEHNYAFEKYQKRFNEIESTHDRTVEQIEKEFNLKRNELEKNINKQLKEVEKQLANSILNKGKLIEALTKLNNKREELILEKWKSLYRDEKNKKVEDIWDWYLESNRENKERYDEKVQRIDAKYPEYSASSSLNSATKTVVYNNRVNTSPQTLAEMYPHSFDNVPRCPKCDSSNIFQGEKGYSITKGVAGAMLTGPIGLVGGMIGKNKIVKRCGKCGYTWNY